MHKNLGRRTFEKWVLGIRRRIWENDSEMFV